MNKEEYEKKLMGPKNTLDMTYHVARVTVHQDLRNSGDITMNNYWSDKENDFDEEYTQVIEQKANPKTFRSQGIPLLNYFII